MIKTIRKAWGIPELRKKIIFTLLILLIFRIGNAITVPYVNTDLLAATLDGMGTTLLGLYNVMSGGAFANATVFALGIQPYINSSIIIQLLTVAIPYLERLARDGGEEGKKKIQAITRYATVAIAVLMSFGYYMMMKNYGLLMPGADGIWPALVIMVSFIAGSSFVMWMGEQVNEFGVGNGIPSSCSPASSPVFPSWFLRVLPSACRVPSTGCGLSCCWFACWHWWFSLSSFRTPSAASPSSTPSVRSVVRCTAVRAPTCP